MSQPEMTFVDSSNLQSIGYDGDQLALWVEFNDGSVYVYNDVPEVLYDELMDAPSKGSFLNRAIKNSFSYSKQ